MDADKKTRFLNDALDRLRAVEESMDEEDALGSGLSAVIRDLETVMSDSFDLAV